MADTVPLAAPRTTLVSSHRSYGSRRVIRDGDALTDDGRRRRRSATPAGASPAFSTSLGDAAGPRRRRRQQRAAPSGRAAWTSSQPSVSTTHFMRARSLLSRLPVWSNTRRTASIVGRRSSLEVKSSSASAGCGLAPRPPATNTRKPASTVPSSSVRVVAMTPTSLNMAWPQSVAQPEKLILNLRGRRWPSGLRTKWRKAASAHGVTSSFSCGQAPARWQAMTLRTVSPQASRLVRPTVPSWRMTSGTLLELHEVELHVLAGGDVAPAARVGVGEVGHHLELLGRDRRPTGS